jgi:hypothetical protein
MVAEWKQHQDTIVAEDEKDAEEAEAKSIDPHDEASPSAQRQKRMIERHKTNIDEWRCQCAMFNHSPYHLCTHLIRVYGKPYPLKRDSVHRQHVTPLLWIDGQHEENQKFQRIPVDELRPMIHEPPASLERLGMNWDAAEDLEDMEDGLPEYSRIEEDMQEYNAWLERYERACRYARDEIRHSRERFRRLPKPSAKGMTSLIRLAGNAHVLDKSRRRRPTWSRERAGANLYRY